MNPLVANAVSTVSAGSGVIDSAAGSTILANDALEASAFPTAIPFAIVVHAPGDQTRFERMRVIGFDNNRTFVVSRGYFGDTPLDDIAEGWVFYAPVNQDDLATLSAIPEEDEVTVALPGGEISFDEDFVLGLAGPQGPKGDQGPQGPQGLRGPSGGGGSGLPPDDPQREAILFANISPGGSSSGNVTAVPTGRIGRIYMVTISSSVPVRADILRVSGVTTIEDTIYTGAGESYQWEPPDPRFTDFDGDDVTAWGVQVYNLSPHLTADIRVVFWWDDAIPG